MLRREFLKLFGFPPIATASAAASSETDAIVDVKQFGAMGDGTHDDTEPLQRAIDFALANAKACFVPAGRYRTSRPLNIGRHGGRNLQQGFTLYGVGRAVANSGGTGGTLIQMTGVGQKAIISLESSVWRSATISDIGLECSEKSGASYGLLFDSTEFSGHLVRNVAVHGAKVAFGILKGSGANGENTLFENCHATDVDRFFYSNAGQAYVQNFIHCSCVLNSGGIYFHLDLVSGGGGLAVMDFNGTAARPPSGGPSNTTLVKNENSNSCMNFVGGRIERLTQLYQTKGGSTNLHVTADFRGLQLTVDKCAGELGLCFVQIQTCPDILNISSCSVEGISGNEIIEIYANELWGYVLFSGCFFDSLAQPPSIICDFSDISNQIRFENCKAVTRFEEQIGRRPIPFERNIHEDIGAIGRRKAYSENGWIHSGLPTNLLVLPHFTHLNGRGLQAEPPWVHAGADHFMNAFGWHQSPISLKSSSPWAKLIELPPRSGLFQDVSSVDLSSTNTNYEIRGAKFHLVAYQAMLGRLAGRGVVFSLSDSIDGTIFDQFQFAEGSANKTFTRIVTLTAYVARKSTQSYVRLAIENTSSDWASIEFRWQLAANNSNPAFVGTSESPSIFVGEWGISAETARFWHRLALPYKEDDFGSESTWPLDDLHSDIYLSRSKERIQSFANGRWWSSPRMSCLPSEPVNGYWAHGDIAMNSSPSSGAPLGWIQILPGDVVPQTHWVPARAYVAGMRVYSGESVYDCIRSGVSGMSSAPVHRDGNAEDGTCVWKFVGSLAPVACDRAWSAGKFELQTQVHHLGNVYECTIAGDSTIAPTGLVESVKDGAINWRFVGRRASFKVISLIEK